MSASITVHTRKRLWARSGNHCAYPGCTRELLQPTAAGEDDTVIGKECHIVAQTDDDPSVARSPCLLTDEEKHRWAHLIDHRHHFDNLVLLCGVHSDIVDDPKQRVSVADLVEIKKAHEQEIEARLREMLVQSARTIEGAAEASQVARPLVLDDVGSWQRKSIIALNDEKPEELSWLRGEIGEPPDPDRIKVLIARWPDALRQHSDLAAVAVIRHAEAVGLWAEAADGWQHYADRADDDAERADRLVRAAIDAQVAGDHERRERLLADAQETDPDCPRLLLDRLDVDIAPAERLARLAEIQTDDRPLAAIVACQKALTSLMLPDLDAAKRYLAEAEQLDPGSVPARIVDVNIRVQRARIALISDQAFRLAEALSAQEDGLSLRDELTSMGRWSESGRLLMLAADVSGALRDLEGSEAVLRRALPEEVATLDGAVVLGDAALRAGAPKLALEFIEQAPESDATARIRAAAKVDIGGPGRAEGLETLEKLALSDSPEREQAAAERLAACMAPVRAPWNEQVADVLMSTASADMVSKLRPMVLASKGDFVEAERLASQLPDNVASAEVRLRIAGMRGQHSGMKEAAETFLDFGPDATGRLIAAAALAAAGERRRAGEITAQIAHDPNAPPRVRADAFDTLLRTLADRDRWNDADREWREFQAFSNSDLGGRDGRVSAWQVRILHHRSHGKSH